MPRIQAAVLSATTVVPWWDAQWTYRLSITVSANGYKRTDKPVEVPLNFTSILSGLGQSGDFDPNSLRVLEVDGVGNVIATVPFQFDRAATFNKLTNAAGTLVFLLNGVT